MDQMTPMEKLDALGNILDKIGDLPFGGRSKCGLIWVANDVVNGLSEDFKNYELQIQALKEKIDAQNSQKVEDATETEEETEVEAEAET